MPWERANKRVEDTSSPTVAEITKELKMKIRTLSGRRIPVVRAWSVGVGARNIRGEGRRGARRREGLSAVWNIGSVRSSIRVPKRAIGVGDGLRFPCRAGALAGSAELGVGRTRAVWGWRIDSETLKDCLIFTASVMPPLRFRVVQEGAHVTSAKTKRSRSPSLLRIASDKRYSLAR